MSSRSIRPPRIIHDRFLATLVRVAAVTAGGVILLIVLFVLRESWPALRDVGIGKFLLSTTWSPTNGAYGLGAMFLSTLALATGAIILAAPLGIACAIVARAYAPRPLAWLIRRAIELLAGVPSVVYGLWGIEALAPLIAEVQPPGQFLITGIIVLAIMILPTIALTTDAALSDVYDEVSRAGAALALTRATIIARLALPSVRSGIIAGIVLAVGRAIGETMAVMMVCGNVIQLPGNPFAPVRALTANIGLEMSYATADHRAVLFASGLLLIGLVITLLFTAAVVRRAGRSTRVA